MDAPGFEIREAQEADIAGVRRLYIELHDYSALHVPSRLRIEDDYDEEKQVAYARKLIAGDGSCLLLAVREGTPIGLAEVHIQEPETELGAVPVRRGHLQSLVVTGSDRARGVGKALLDASEGWARARGAEEMELDHWVFEGDPGGFYERAGYIELSAMRVKPLTDPSSG